MVSSKTRQSNSRDHFPFQEDRKSIRNRRQGLPGPANDLDPVAVGLHTVEREPHIEKASVPALGGRLFGEIEGLLGARLGGTGPVAQQIISSDVTIGAGMIGGQPKAARENQGMLTL